MSDDNCNNCDDVYCKLAGCMRAYMKRPPQPRGVVSADAIRAYEATAALGAPYCDGSGTPYPPHVVDTKA